MTAPRTALSVIGVLLVLGTGWLAVRLFPWLIDPVDPPGTDVPGYRLDSFTAPDLEEAPPGPGRGSHRRPSAEYDPLTPDPVELLHGAAGGRRTFFQYVRAGERERSVDRYFQDLDRRVLGRAYERGGWRQLVHSPVVDAVVLGWIDQVEVVPSCEYSTEIVVQVYQYLKVPSHGRQDSLLTFKLPYPVSHRHGRGGEDVTVFISGEPSFRVGEQVLLTLTRVPFLLHQVTESHPCPVHLEPWYRTEILPEEDYFEALFTGAGCGVAPAIPYQFHRYANPGGKVFFDGQRQYPHDVVVQITEELHGSPHGE